MNLRGEAEPPIFPFTSSNPNANTPLGASDLDRTNTDASDKPPAAVVIIKDVARGVGHSSRAIVTLPLQMWNAIAVGFHNAPRLYGDKTVRPSPQRITGFRTGFKAAGKEFWLGMYDGVCGVVRIPYQEVHENGVSELPVGVARGLGGLVLK